jgi:hypothetical protein
MTIEDAKALAPEKTPREPKPSRKNSPQQSDAMREVIEARSATTT